MHEDEDAYAKGRTLENKRNYQAISHIPRLIPETKMAQKTSKYNYYIDCL